MNGDTYKGNERNLGTLETWILLQLPIGEQIGCIWKGVSPYFKVHDGFVCF